MSHLTKSANLGRSSWYIRTTSIIPINVTNTLVLTYFLKGKTVVAKMGMSRRPQRVSYVCFCWLHGFGTCLWSEGRASAFLPFRSQLRWAFPGQRRARPPTESSLYTFLVLKKQSQNNLSSMKKKSTTSTVLAKTQRTGLGISMNPWFMHNLIWGGGAVFFSHLGTSESLHPVPSFNSQFNTWLPIPPQQEGWRRLAARGPSGSHGTDLTAKKFGNDLLYFLGCTTCHVGS